MAVKKSRQKQLKKDGLPALGQQNGLDRWVRTTDRLRKCKNIELENFGQSGTLINKNLFSSCRGLFLINDLLKGGLLDGGAYFKPYISSIAYIIICVKENNKWTF